METQNIADSQELPVELSDAAWNSILPFLRDCRNVYVGTPEKCRHFLSAVLWITKEGATWRALPKVYGNWNAIYRRFSRWCDAGVFEALHEHFDACIPLRFILIAGHRNDITQAPALIEGYSYEYVIGDKAYDSDAFIAEITSQDAIAVIPPRKGRTGFPREYDKELYKRRNLIERFFGGLKQYRRVATRYDKLGVRYLGFVYFAAILVTTHKM